MEKIMQLLNNQIVELEQLIYDLNQLLENNQIIENDIELKKSLELVLNDNINYIINIDFEKLSSCFPDAVEYNEETKINIDICKDILSDNFFYLNSEQKRFIIDICSKYCDKISLKIKQQEEQERNQQLLLEKMNELKNIKEYIMSNSINEEYIDKIVKFIKSLTVDKVTKIELLMDFGKSLYRVPEQQIDIGFVESGEEIENDENEIEMIPENTVQLDEQSLIALFKRYGCDYNVFRDDDKIKMRKYGSLTTIEEILSVLANYKGIFITENSKHLTTILLLSEKSIVDNIIENIKQDLGYEASVYEIENILEYYVKFPSIFVRRKKGYSINEDEGGPSGKNNSVSGAYNNYLANRKYFIELGIDINLAMRKCGSIFPTNPQSIKNKVASYELYDIPKEVYLLTLSSLKASSPLDTLDLFIEIGCYDYVLHNPSRLLLDVEHPIFYRIVKAKQEGKPIYRQVPDPITKVGTYTLRGNIIYDKEDEYNIKITKTKDENGKDKKTSNGPQVVGKYDYFQETENLYKKYELFKDTMSSLEPEEVFMPIILVGEDKIIKKVEEYFKVSGNSKVYNFGGVIISRYKVLRTYEILIKKGLAGSFDSLMFAVTRNSILTESQSKTIEKALSDRIFTPDRSPGSRGVE